MNIIIMTTKLIFNWYKVLKEGLQRFAQNKIKDALKTELCVEIDFYIGR